MGLRRTGDVGTLDTGLIGVGTKILESWVSQKKREDMIQGDVVGKRIWKERCTCKQTRRVVIHQKRLGQQRSETLDA
jgi:hypothetical protein